MEFIKRNTKLFIISGRARSGKNTVAKLIEEHYKDKKYITISFGYYIKDYAKRISNWDGSEENKPRELLQQLGIELIKNKINDRLFINRIIDDIEVFSYFYDVIIVSDARLKDEVETLKNKYKNSISIRVNRNSDNGLSKDEKNHLTETNLDNYDKFDKTIENINYDLLKLDVEKILNEVELW